MAETKIYLTFGKSGSYYKGLLYGFLAGIFIMAIIGSIKMFIW